MGTADEVRDRLPIEQVVGEVVALKRAGASFKGLCPFHHEKTPSFIVTPSKGMYKCFGCGESGDVFSFIMKTRNMDFPAALRELAARAGVEVEEPERDRAGGGLKARIYEANAAAATYFQSMLAAAAGARAREYLRARRITAETIDRFGLGYAPDARDGLCARLRQSGYGDEELVTAGLAIASEEGGPTRDRFRGRLMFPIRDARGRILGFGGRVLGDFEPKYLNSPATPVFDKSRVLYAIEHAEDAVRQAREGVVVEGYVDALRAHQEGFRNVVATLGTAITEAQLRLLARLAPRLVLALDADAAGQKAAVRAGLAALAALPKGAEAAALGAGGRRERVQVYVATLPDGQDPDDAIAADPELWRTAIAGSALLMDHYFGLVESSLDRARPDWRQEAVDALSPAIGQLDGIGVQQAYIDRLAALTGIDARHLRDITPGGARYAASAGRAAGRRSPPQSAPAAAPLDPVRVTEEYLVGLLLLHRPLPSEVRAELSGYAPSTADLAPLVRGLLVNTDEPPGPIDVGHDDLADRLLDAARRQPPVDARHLTGAVRLCLSRLNEERARRQLLDLGRVLGEVDGETARQMSPRALEALALKEQMTARLQTEQTQQRRQPAIVGGDGENLAP